MSGPRARGSSPPVAPDDDLVAEAFRARPIATTISRLDDGTLTDVNEGFTQLSGYERWEVLGRTTVELGLWAEPQQRDSLVTDLLRDGIAPNRSLLVRAKSGELFEAQFSAWVIDHDGVRYLVAEFEDPTRRERTERELRETEAKYRSLVEAIPAVVYVDVADESMMTTYVSPQIETLLGVASEEYVADPDLWARLLHPEDRERAIRRYEEGSRSGRPFSFEYRMIRRDGSTIWIRDDVTPVEAEAGRPGFLQGIMLDVTDVRLAQEAVRRSEALLRATIESTADGILVVSPDGRTLFANGRFAEIWSIPPDMLERRDDDEMLGFVLDQLADPQAFLQKVRALYATDEESFDTIPFKDGRIIERFSRPLLQDGRNVGRVWSFRDVTDRFRAERQLLEAEARYRTLVEQIPAVLYVDQPDESLQTIYVSPQVGSILGVPAEEWIADPHSWDRHVHPDDRSRVLEQYHAFLRTGVMPGPASGIEYRWLRPDGGELWLYDTAAFVHDERGAPLFLQGVMFDITERKRAEEELRESMDLLATSHAERRSLLARLVAAQEEERQRIAADIHDDPIQKMTAVGLRLEAFKRRGAVEEHHRLLEELEKSVELAIGRLRHLMFELRPPALDRDGLAAALRQELDELAREENLDVRLDDRLTSEPPPTTRTIAFRIAQEALVNARKHAAARRIDVLLESRDEGLFVRVRDDGAGFTPAEGGSQPGHLGLTAMREQTEMAGGWFRVASSRASGTTVEFSLPLRDGEG
jgi:PAS domain S-box-containing protein